MLKKKDSIPLRSYCPEEKSFSKEFIPLGNRRVQFSKYKKTFYAVVGMQQS
jgi:hypothetical protein